jgi:modification methylase
MIFPEDFVNKIICGDCISVMKQMPNECLDLVVTSPPYNLKNSTGNGMKDGRGGKWKNTALVNGYSNYNDNMPQKGWVSYGIN